MKTLVWLLLITMMCMSGCARGYYEKGTVSPEPPKLSGMTYQNPETQEEEVQRIWRESLGR